MATAAAAIMAKARRDVIEDFMRADAVTPERAIPYHPERRVVRRTFERFQARGVLRAAGEERWYLDVPTYAARTKRRRRLALGGIAAALAVVGAALLAH